METVLFCVLALAALMIAAFAAVGCVVFVWFTLRERRRGIAEDERTEAERHKAELMQQGFENIMNYGMGGDGDG